ncbi:hypothetical protein GCM10027053_01680 [Intrasporangium mesophilum]
MFVPITATPSPSPSPSPTTTVAVVAAGDPSTVSAGTIGGATLGTLVLWLALALVVTGVLVFLIRLVFSKGKDGESSEDKSVVRGWLAILLVSGLLLFCAVSFFVTDAAPRNLLIGGIVASAGTVTAFYFASKSNEQTQKNFLDAAFGPTAVDFPGLEDMTIAQAQRVLNNLKLNSVLNPSTAQPGDRVRTTVPTAGTKVKAGDVVTLST